MATVRLKDRVLKSIRCSLILWPLLPTNNASHNGRMLLESFPRNAFGHFSQSTACIMCLKSFHGWTDMLCYSTGTAYIFAVASLPLSLGVNPIRAASSMWWLGEWDGGETDSGVPALSLLPPPNSPRPEKLQLPSLEKVVEEKQLTMGSPAGPPLQVTVTQCPSTSSVWRGPVFKVWGPIPGLLISRSGRSENLHL